MNSQLAMSAMHVAEFLLWAVLAFLFWKKSLVEKRFPAMDDIPWPAPSGHSPH